MSDRDNERQIDRIDRKLGRAWSGAGGAVFGIFGLFLLVEALGGESWFDRWPLLIGAVILFVLARLCFTSRRGLGDLLDEGPGQRRG